RPSVPYSTLIPYTTLFRSSWHTRKVCSESFRKNSGFGCPWKVIRICAAGGRTMNLKGKKIGVALTGSFCTYKKVIQELEKMAEEDRKSTRLNSSHVSITYA